MNGNDLMERRVERGTPRGAMVVLAEAQAVVDGALENPHKRRQRRHFLLLFGFWAVLALVVFVIDINANPNAFDEQLFEPDTTIVGPTALTSAEPLPLPILVDDMTLVETRRPSNEEFDADDLFGEGPSGTFSRRTSNVPFIVFGDPDQPFDGPVFGVEVFNFAPVSFEVFTANLDPATVEELTEGVSVASTGFGNGDVALAPGSGLVPLVDRLDPFRITDDQFWEFTFFGESEDLLLTSRTSEARTRGSEVSETQSQWDTIFDNSTIWGASPDATIRSVEVLGQTGVQISTDMPDMRFVGPSGVLGPEGIDNLTYNEFIWTQDDFTYVITDFGADDEFAEKLSRLTLAGRVEWNTAVAQSDFQSPSADLSVLALPILAILFAFTFITPKRPRRVDPFIAGVLALAGATLFFSYLSSIWLTLALSVPFSVLVFWRHRQKVAKHRSVPTATYQLLE